MDYSYAFYSKNFFEIPLLCLIVLVPTMIYTIIVQVRRLVRTKDFSASSLVQAIVAVLVIVSFVINNAVTLASGGVWLYSEKESDAVCTEGIVTKVDRIGKYEVEIWIDGELYIASEKGNFEEGESVRIEYLPKSRFILSQEDISPSD